MASGFSEVQSFVTCFDDRVEIPLFDYLGNKITSLYEPLEICLASLVDDNYKDERELCLAYYHEEKEE